MQILNFGEENHKVLVIENFLANPEDLIVHAQKSSFAPWPMAAERKGYPGVRAAAPEGHGEQIMDRIDSLVREQYEIPPAES